MSRPWNRERLTVLVGRIELGLSNVECAGVGSVVGSSGLAAAWTAKRSTRKDSGGLLG